MTLGLRNPRKKEIKKERMFSNNSSTPNKTPTLDGKKYIYEFSKKTSLAFIFLFFFAHRRV